MINYVVTITVQIIVDAEDPDKAESKACGMLKAGDVIDVEVEPNGYPD